jgi:citrate synthase
MRLSNDFARLKIEQREFELPVVKATHGPDGILVSPLKNDSFVTLDPGFLTTAQCESKITFIDGAQSILRYRGYPIEDLAANSTFLETAYLLIYGYLPNHEQHDAFIEDINHRTLIGDDFRSFLGGFPRDAHPMAVLASAMNAMETFIPETADINDPEAVDNAIKNIIAKVRTVVAFIYRRMKNEPLLYPDYSRGYVDDFVRMCFATPYQHFESNKLFVSALDKLLILQSDHEQNCSTSVVRVTASSDSSLYACVSAGINALSGPLHGGANERALKQLQEISEHIQAGGTTRSYVDQVAASGRKIAGLGHRVYTSYDPRAAIAKQYAIEILNQGVGDLDLFNIALELEEIAANDPYFTDRNLYPNIDFWTCLVYHALGFDKELFTALFAMARIPGWIAHWKEMHADPMHKIGRPRQVYTGKIYQEYTALSER